MKYNGEVKMKKSELKEIIKEVINEWKWSDPEFKDAKEIYHGWAFVGNKENEDRFFTVKNKTLWKFVHGVNDTKNPPYVQPIKKVNIKFPKGDNNIEYEGEPFGPLGQVIIYKLKNGKYLWEY